MTSFAESHPPSRTRADLLSAGLQLFGQKGFAATSTRELAELANANIGSISYHFDGKEGLYRACGVEVARRMHSVVGAADPKRVLTPEMAQQTLETIVRALVLFFNSSHQADDMVAFMLREITFGGLAFDTIYAEMIEPKHRELCILWAMAGGGDPDSDEVKLEVFSFLGQVLYFRIGRNIVGRRMGWDDVAPEHAAKIAEILIKNLRKLLHEGGSS